MVDWVAPQKNARVQLVVEVVLNRNNMDSTPSSGQENMLVTDDRQGTASLLTECC